MGGGGKKVQYIKTTGSRLLGPGSLGGAVFYQAASRPPSYLQIIPSAQSGSETSGAGELSKV